MPSDQVQFECDGTAVPVRFRINMPGGVGVTTPMGLQPVERVSVSSDADGVLITVDLAHEDPAAVLRRLS